MTSSPTDTVRPFRLDIPQSDLDDPYDRLDRPRWPDDLSGTGWAYGVPADYLRELGTALAALLRRAGGPRRC